MRKDFVRVHVEEPERVLEERSIEELRRFDLLKVRKLRLDGEFELVVTNLFDDGSVEIMVSRLTLTRAQLEDLREEIVEIWGYEELFKG